MGGKDQEYTIGYRYYAGVHMVLCHGPVDVVNRIIVGEKLAWEGTSNGEDGETLRINPPNLFGGNNAEARIAGELAIHLGKDWQDPDEYMNHYVIHEMCSAFRGVVSVVLRDFMICSMTPYPKPWRFRVARIPAPFGASDNATDGYAANPAMIIADCLANRDWGLGLDPGELDQASFQDAARC